MASPNRKVIPLSVPVRAGGGKLFRQVVLAPCTLGLVDRWKDGEFQGVKALLAHLSGLTTAEIDNIEFPDADRVTAEFVGHLPSVIADDIVAGIVPVDQRRQEPAPLPAPAVDHGELPGIPNGAFPLNEDGASGLPMDVDGYPLGAEGQKAPPIPELIGPDPVYDDGKVPFTYGPQDPADDVLGDLARS